MDEPTMPTPTDRSAQIEQWAVDLEQEIPLITSKFEKLPLDAGIEPHALLVEVLKFLFLVSQTERSLSPSQTVDLGWHEFILFTRSYAAFCEQKLGKFVHHQPDDNRKANHQRFEQTIYRYSAAFGEPPKAIWGDFAHAEWQSLNCGSCQTL